MKTPLVRLFLTLSFLVFLPQVSSAAGCAPAAGSWFSCSTPGNYTYNVGAYKTINITAIGAGGGGGGGVSGTNNWTAGGGGGGGGAGTNVSGIYDVYPGQTVFIYIGDGGARGIVGDELNIPVGIQGLPGIPSMVSGFLSGQGYLSASGGDGGQPGQAMWPQMVAFVEGEGGYKDYAHYDWESNTYYYYYFTMLLFLSCPSAPWGGSLLCPVYYYDPNNLRNSPASGAGGSIGGQHGYGPDIFGAYRSLGGSGGSSSVGAGGKAGGSLVGTNAGKGGAGAGGGGGGSAGTVPNNDEYSLPAAGGPGYVSITGRDPCSLSVGTSCSKSANSCGVAGYATSDWGTVQCDGSCSVSGVSAELPYWNNSYTVFNSCDDSITRYTDCSGGGDYTPPAERAGFNTECSGGTNSCGDSNPGYFVCSGTGVACSASGPPAQRSYYGATCTLTSATNACGQTTTVSTAGSYDCNYTCTGTPPAPPSNAACAPTTPTISGLYQSGVNLGPSAPAYDPSGYQIYANATSPAGYDLTYYFEFSTDGINWSGDPAPAQWATLPP